MIADCATWMYFLGLQAHLQVTHGRRCISHNQEEDAASPNQFVQCMVRVPDLSLESGVDNG
jgi:hypothetical protein